MSVSAEVSVGTVNCGWRVGKEPCTQFTIGKKCHILGMFKSQSEAGGFDNEKGERGSNGPYWRRDSWEDFQRRSVDFVKGKGCPFSDLIRTEGQNITVQKEDRGELL